MKYLLLGNSAAAIAAAEAIRRYDDRGEIHLVADEPHHTYSRPMVSEWLYLAPQALGAKDIAYRPESFYEDLRLHTLLGKRAKSIDASAKTLSLEEGEKLSFEKLLIAVGGSPIVPEISGLPHPCACTFTRLADAEKVRSLVSTGMPVVVVGGGLIGTKAAEALALLGAEVTIVELADRILSTAYDARASEVFTHRLRDRGIEIVLNDSVKAVVTQGEEMREAVLASGASLPCRVLVLAIGVRPNVALAKEAGLEVNRGIVVDDYMETSVKDIYAAGDCAEGKELLSGQKRCLPLWPVATQMGAVAGANMAGHQTPYQGGLAMNSLSLFHLPAIAVGQVQADQESRELTYEDTTQGVYRKLVVKDGRLVGYVLVGAVDRAGILTGIIKKGREITGLEQKLLSPELSWLDLPKEWRAERLRVS